MLLTKGDVQLVVTPETGGSISAFRWRGIPVFRNAPENNRKVLDSSNFPLVPYSNRIAYARFGGFRTIPNFPEIEPLHLIHGTGFLAAWRIVSEGHIRHVYDGPNWPSPFTADQRFELHENGYTHHIGITNDGNTLMPAGLGIHPYFPREGAWLDIALTGKWVSDKDRIPQKLEPLSERPDWLTDKPIDNSFTGRKGDIHIHWPTHSLTIQPDNDLSHTVIYCPPGQDFFCVEPVTHMTDAANRTGANAMRMIAPHDSWHVKTRFVVQEGSSGLQL
ncbi:MAG: hypothetical protein ACRCY3_14965 [Sphingorhabdus sp.]